MMTRERLLRTTLFCLVVAAVILTVERVMIWHTLGLAAAGAFSNPSPQHVGLSFTLPDTSEAFKNPFVWVFVVLGAVFLLILRSVGSELPEGHARKHTNSPVPPGPGT
jgi:hypothetical protein